MQQAGRTVAENDVVDVDELTRMVRVETLRAKLAEAEERTEKARDEVARVRFEEERRRDQYRREKIAWKLEQMRETGLALQRVGMCGHAREVMEIVMRILEQEGET